MKRVDKESPGGKTWNGTDASVTVPPPTVAHVQPHPGHDRRFFVFLYRVVSFVLLAVILLGIVIYVATVSFFLIDQRWGLPLRLAPESERVIRVGAQYVQHEYQRNTLELERKQLLKERDLIRDGLMANRNILLRFPMAVSDDLERAHVETQEFQNLRKEYTVSKAVLADTREQLTKLEKESSEKERNAGVIDQETYIRRKYAASQAEANWVNYLQKEIELSSKTYELDRRIRSLNDLKTREDDHRDVKPDGGPSQDIISMEVVINRLRGETKQLDLRASYVDESLSVINKSLAEFDTVMQSMKRLPAFRAMRGDTAFIFVPYSNLRHAKPGKRIYGGSLGFLFASEVGTVEHVFDEEQTIKHPWFRGELRGVLVQVKLKDNKWIEKEVLFFGSKPLLF